MATGRSACRSRGPARRVNRPSRPFVKPNRTITGHMFTLFHHPFCPRSRFVRLALGEHGLDTRLVEELVWERREAFLMLNPAGDTPVLIAEGTPAMPGPSIAA